MQITAWKTGSLQKMIITQLVNSISKLYEIPRRSQWPCGLRHVLSSLARTLGSCVRIPLKAWMFVYVFILCFCCPVYVDIGLATG
jgi:hypothetical protein